MSDELNSVAPLSVLSCIIQAELEFEHRIARSRQLSAFRRNASTWELLLLMALEDGQSDEGIHGTAEKVATRYIGTSALLKFMRERRDDGSLVFEEHDKRSKWRIRLSASVLTELQQALKERNDRLLAALAVQSSLPHDAIGPTVVPRAPHAPAATPLPFPIEAYGAE
jgi:hypothetical protein